MKEVQKIMREIDFYGLSDFTTEARGNINMIIYIGVLDVMDNSLVTTT